MAGKKRSGLANDRRAYGCGRCYIPTYDYTFTGNGVLTQAIVDSEIGTAQNIFIVGYTSIGNSAFFGKTQIRSVTIGNSVTGIRGFAFAGCISLTSITIPTSVTTISGQVFSGCISLTSITIPNSVTSIGLRVFSRCISLTSITIPNSVTSIGSDAFINSGLTNVIIANGQLGILSPYTNVSFFGATVTTQLP